MGESPGGVGVREIKKEGGVYFIERVGGKCKKYKMFCDETKYDSVRHRHKGRRGLSLCPTNSIDTSENKRSK